MKQIFCAVLYLIAISIHAQSLEHSKLHCVVLIDIDYGGNVNVYDNTGKVIKKLKNNLKDSAQDLIYLTIIGKNDSMYNVIASYFMKGIIAKGWVKKNNPHIGIFSICNAIDINLHQKPEKNSKIVCTIRQRIDYFHIRDCESNWLFVSVEISHKKYEGWLSPDMQCYNPYSTCCGR